MTHIEFCFRDAASLEMLGNETKPVSSKWHVVRKGAAIAITGHKSLAVNVGSEISCLLAGRADSRSAVLEAQFAIGIDRIPYSAILRVLALDAAIVGAVGDCVYQTIDVD